MISALDDFTIQAFTLALLQLDVALPASMQQTVHQIGAALENGKPELAARQIRELLRHHLRLEQLYQESYDHLQQRYQAHEKAKGLSAAYKMGEARSQVGPYRQIKNIGVGSAVIALPWQQRMAVPILTSDNPREVARSILKQSRPQTNPRIAFDSAGVLLAALTRTIQKTNAQETAILKAVEYRPLTVEDLTYSVRMSLEQVQTIVSSLWQASYLDVATSGVWQRLISVFGNQAQAQPQPVKPEDYFTLTLKGHFRLHPLVTVKPSQDRT